MERYLIILRNYLKEYSEAKEFKKMRDLFFKFNNFPIDETVRVLEKNYKLKELTETELLYFNELKLANKYYNDMVEMVKRYYALGETEENLKELTALFNDYILDSSIVEFKLAYNLLNSKYRDLLYTVTKEENRENANSKLLLSKKIGKVFELYKDDIKMKDILILLRHYNLTNNNLSSAVGYLRAESNLEDRKKVNEMCRTLYITLSDEGEVAIDILESICDTELIGILQKEYKYEDLKKIVVNAANSKLLNLTMEQKTKLRRFLNRFYANEVRPEEKEKPKIEIKKEPVKKLSINDITLEEAQETVRKYDRSGLHTKVAFCEQSGIRIDYLHLCLEKVEKHNNEIRKTAKKSKISIDLIIDELNDKIKNGVEEDGKKRNFDIIDFYTISGMTIGDFKIAMETRQSRNVGLIVDYLGFKTDTEYSVYGAKLGLMVKDSKNKETLRIITDSETDKLVNYLKGLDIPVNKATYKAAARRYVDGYLVLDQKVKSR